MLHNKPLSTSTSATNSFSPGLLEMTQHHSRHTGYTIVEMLVVLAIIILVATMTIPAIIALTGGGGTRSSASILQAALWNARQYAVNTRSNQECIIVQQTDLTQMANPLRTYSKMQIYQREPATKQRTVSYSLFPKYIHIWPYKYQNGALSALAYTSNRYTITEFQPDGATTLGSIAATTRINIVDITTVNGNSEWYSRNYVQDWDDMVIEISNITGRISIIDPDLE
ncbi:MAG TPA: hypothetical protein EYP10_03555 [Armatimonadetes bacterium]|nr:hypothetical protein [Armatimonadota bacterium]